MMNRGFGFLLTMLLLGGGQAAAEPPATPEAGTPPPVATPRAEQSVTEQTARIGGVQLAYRATAGTLLIRDDADESVAAIGYVAYTKKGAEAARRPLTFAYNGGPGSSSIWLHMGALGPRRVVTPDPEPAPPPPYEIVDNEESPLDVTDLVLIDPVGTGLSRAVGKAKDADFWGVDQDIDSLSRFIVQYVSDNGRWNSPKYLLGESYGTMRSAGLVDRLQSKWDMAFNGVILVSVFIDAKTASTMAGNDLGFQMFLPTYAATAWYHGLIPDAPPLAELLADARRFALGPYAAALAKGDALPATERREVIAELARLTALSPDYLDRANLRVRESEFVAELLRTHGQIVGRLDSRYTGIGLDRLAQGVFDDPQAAAISGAYVAGFLSYYHGELKFGAGKTYRVSADLWRRWDWKHEVPGAFIPMPGLPDTSPDLARAMAYNPHLRLLVLNGYYDLATPFFGTEYTLDHLGLPPALRENIEIHSFEAGHMMYLHAPSRRLFKETIAEFVTRTSRR
ncbi:MAG TPA: hypothetical protein PKM64_05445 [Thermoanaerobaculia bacterium]|nr:hypothetical protein [Thermoanaerobaculia bacterium]